jgi:hypothetical protein
MLMTSELTVIKKDNHRTESEQSQHSAQEYKMVVEHSRNLRVLDFDVFRGDLNFILQTYHKTT